MQKPKHCSIKNCKRPAYVKGFCNTHYSRVQRHGNPLHKPRRSPWHGAKEALASLRAGKC